MNPETAADELWRAKPEVIRGFLESRPSYEKLSEEVAFILEAAIRKGEIEFAAVTFRAKTLESFCEKAVRKEYPDPLKQITDFSGVRVVYLYKSDKNRIEAIIEEEFDVLEKIDTVGSSEPEKFGYGALHYSVSLAGRTTGARYDELRSLPCEIQVRTILQDGWAIIAHHLSYKQEADVPAELRRKLNALSGLFETADDQFDRVRDERLKYTGRIKHEIATASEEFLDAPLNLDSLAEYLRWKLPNRLHMDRDKVAELLDELRLLQCETIRDVESGVRRALKAVEAREQKYLRDEAGQPMQFADVGVVRVAFYFLHKKHRDERITETGARKEYEELETLVEQ